MEIKKIVIIIILILLIIGTLYLIIKEDPDNIKFKNEYEKYNNLTYNENNKKESFYNVKIEKENPIIYLTNETVIEEMKKENKLIFIGTAENNDTRKSMETLLQVAKDNGIEKIYYYDIKDEINNKDSKIYQELTKKLNKKEISIPLLMLIKDKKVENYNEGLKNQKELSTKYEEIMIDYLMCTSSC